MTKFKITWVMEVDDNELLEMINNYREVEDNLEPLESLEGVSEEALIEVMDYEDYIEQEVDEYFDRSTAIIELLPNEKV